MHIKLKHFFLFSFYIVTSATFAQITTSNGYILTNTNDTIFGRLEYSYTGFFNKCVFIKENSKTIEFLSPNQIKSFFISPDIKFQSKEFNKEKSFYNVLSEGKINLYNDDNFHLYISNSSDSLVQLSGGEKTISRDGKYYSEKVNTYKLQIKRCTKDTSYYKSIDKLYFDKKPITQLFNDINNQKQSPYSKVKKNNQNYFSFEIGYSLNSFQSKYSNDTLTFGRDYSINNRTSSWSFGIDYKRKLLKTNSYIAAKLRFEKTLNNSSNHEEFLHSGILVLPNDGREPYYADTIGKLIDTYSYELNSINIPISYHKEISYNKFRPFYEIGISFRYYIKNDCFRLRRKYINQAPVVEEENNKLRIPSFSSGFNIGIGGRYLINMDHSISIGLNLEIYLHSKFSEFNSRREIFNRLYVSYGF